MQFDPTAVSVKMKKKKVFYGSSSSLCCVLHVLIETLIFPGKKIALFSAKSKHGGPDTFTEKSEKEHNGVASDKSVDAWKSEGLIREILLFQILNVIPAL